MLKVLGINEHTANERGIIVEVSKGVRPKVEHFWFVKSFSAFTIQLSRGDIYIEESPKTTLLYIPIKEHQFKNFKEYVNTIEDVLDSIEFKFQPVDYERFEITGITSTIFDIDSSQEVYDMLYEIKKSDISRKLK